MRRGSAVTLLGGIVRVRVGVSTRDRYPSVTLVAVLGALAAVALLLFGLPPVGFHAPWHYAGVMGPLCGGTRAAHLTVLGDLDAAWAYNPLGLLAALAAPVATARAVAGWATGRWWDVDVRAGRAVVAGTWAVGAALLIALTVRQQAIADLLLTAG